MNQHPSNFFSLFLFLLLLSLLLILLDDRKLLGFAKGGIEAVVIPLRARIYAQKLESIPNKEGDDIRERRKIADLESQISMLRLENAAMKRLLGNQSLPQTWSLLPSQIIGQTSLEFLQIDKGRVEGVEEQMVLVSEENSFVGKVIKVSEHSSQVLLPLSGSSKILAMSLNAESKEIQSRGILAGQGGRAVYDRVTLNEQLSTGDLLVTAGDESLPPNIFLGRLNKVIRKEGELFQRAEMEPAINYQALKIVFVVTNSK